MNERLRAAVVSLFWVGLAAGAASVVGACAPKAPSYAKQPGISSRHAPLRGSLTENVEEIQNHEMAEPCDDRWSGARSRIAAALDRRESELKALNGTLASTTSFSRVSVGPFQLRDYGAAREAVPGWQEEINSWKDASRLYESIKNQPVDRRWLSLNAYARSLIVDDLDRLEGKNVYLDRESGPRLENAIRSIGECIHASNACEFVAFDTDTQDFLSGNPYFREYLDRVEDAVSPESRASIYREFRGALEMDYGDAFKFVKNSSVSREGAEVVLPLGAGPFSEATEKFSELIEQVWQSADLQVKIRWNNGPASVPGVFSLFAGSEMGQRPFVSYQEKTLNLFAETNIRAIVHEIGHVLGLPDRYYSVWRPSTCEYAIQFNEEDLMSNGSTGSVVTGDWNTLNQVYPSQPDSN